MSSPLKKIFTQGSLEIPLRELDYHRVVMSLLKKKSTQLKTPRTNKPMDQTETKPHPLVACLHAHRASCTKRSLPSSSLSRAIFLATKIFGTLVVPSSLRLPCHLNQKQLHRVTEWRLLLFLFWVDVFSLSTLEEKNTFPFKWAGGW